MIPINLIVYTPKIKEDKKELPRPVLFPNTGKYDPLQKRQVSSILKLVYLLIHFAILSVLFYVRGVRYGGRKDH